MNFFNHALSKKIFATFLIFIISFSIIQIPKARAEGAYDAVGGFATCSAGQILGRLVSSAVGQAIGGITNALSKKAADKATEAVADEAITQDKVPVYDKKVDEKGEAIALNTMKVSMKTVGGGETGGGMLSGTFKMLKDSTEVSLDSIMFCVVNEVMTYITNSTIQWINNGFQGSPVFVQNPQRIMQNIADREVGNFTYELSRGVKSIARSATNQVGQEVRRSIINIAEPIRAQVTQNIIGSYNASFQDSIRPTLNALRPENYNSCINGNWNACGGFAGFAELVNPENNTYGATHMAKMKVYKNIAEQQQYQKEEFAANNYNKSFKTCPQGSSRGYDGSCNPLNSTVTTPGFLIGQEMQSRGLMKYMRVAVAKDFDSVITALVNQLIKVAINKVYEVGGEAQASLNEAF